MGTLIGVYSPPGGYAERLAAYINSRRDIGYGAVALKTDPEIEGFLHSDELSVLLTVDPKHLSVYNKIRVCLLTEDRDEAENCETGDVLFKYLRAPVLLGKLFPDMSRELVKNNLYTIYSPSSNLAARAFAAEKAEELSHAGKTLLLCWDPFGAFGRDGMEGVSISELLFAARSNRKGFGKMLLRMRNDRGCFAFKGVDFYSDLWQFSADEMEKLADMCRADGSFDNIVFECAFISDAVERLMEISDEVILVKSGESDPGPDEFLRQMKYAGKQGIINRTGVVTV